MTVPVLQNYTSRRGARTLANQGAADLKLLMQTGGEPATSATITLTGGTAGHWSLPSDLTHPTPTSTGDAAELNGGPYTFSVVFHGPSGDSVAKTLTINIAANVFSIGKPGDVDGNPGIKSVLTAAGLKGTLGGASIEVVKGSAAAFAAGTATLLVRNFNVHGSTPLKITSEDQSAGNRSVISSLTIKGCYYVDVTALAFERHCAPYGPYVGAAVPTSTVYNANQNFYAVLVQWASNDGPSDHLSFYDLDIGSDPSADLPCQWSGAFSISGNLSSPYQPQTNILIHDVRLTRVTNGYELANVDGWEVYNSVIDHFASNAWFCSDLQNAQNGGYHDSISCRPFINRCLPGDHADHLQMGPTETSPTGVPQSTVRDYVNDAYRRLMLIQADGDRICQGPFFDGMTQRTSSPWAPSGFKVLNWSIDGVFYDGGATQGMALEGGDGWDIRHVTAIRGELRNASNVDLTTGALTSPPVILVPSLAADRGVNLQVPINGTVRDSIFQHVGGQAQLSTFLPDIWIDMAGGNKAAGQSGVRILKNMVADPVAISGTANVADADKSRSDYYKGPGNTWFANPRCNDLDYSSLTAIQIAIEMRKRYAAVLTGGAFINADGTVAGCFMPYAGGVVTWPFALGTDWNDGSVYGLTPETAYGTFASPSTVVAGSAVSITYTANAAVTADLTITPAASGVAGSFSSPTAVIPIGQNSVTITFTPSAAGTLHLTSTNNRGLPDPPQADVTVTAAGNAPTAIALSLSTSALAIGSACGLTFTLDRVATQNVVITPTVSGVSGSFVPSSILITPGFKVATANFVPSSTGVASLSCTNDRALANPAASPLTVAFQIVSKGTMRRLGIKV